jgi:hypothetical protein
MLHSPQQKQQLEHEANNREEQGKEAQKRFTKIQADLEVKRDVLVRGRN